MSAKRSIQVVGADANNLREVGLEIVENALTAIVGVSGSGKSSLVEDTLAAEASVRMRRFLKVDIGVPEQDVRAFIGELPPTILVGQRAFHASSRTTIATATPLLRLLRRLFSQYSIVFADDVGAAVPTPTPEAFATWLTRHAQGRAVVWAVPVQFQATTGVAAVQNLKDAGLREAVVYSETDHGKRLETGTLLRLEKFKPLRADVRHTIEARVGEVRLGAKSSGPLLESLRQAWQAGGGGVFVELLDSKRPDLKRTFTHGLDSRRHRVHPDSPKVFRAPTTHLLSFNAPEHDESGACPVCKGLGTASVVNEARLVPHPERSMHQGAFALWTPKNYKYVNVQHETIEGLRGRAGFDPDKPWRKLSDEARALILDGSPDPVEDRDPKTKKKASAPHEFAGFRPAIQERAGRRTPAGEALLAFVHNGPCVACQGTRWNDMARAPRVDGLSIDHILATPFTELATQFHETTSGKKAESSSLRANITRFAESMVKVGLGHLSGDRGMLNVSDGESRRVRIAGALNSRLAGLLLVLDEPGRGLHEADLVALGDSIADAAELHTVVMSEHRQRLVARANQIVEMGPGAGVNGGQIVRMGSPRGTRWDSAAKIAPRSVAPRKKTKATWLRLAGATIHNVRDADIRIPIGSLTCLAGVSGSGKSSFVRGVLVPAVIQALPADLVDIEEFRTRLGTWHLTEGIEHIGALHALDQSPSSAQRRSIVATFLDVAEHIRRSFAGTADAKKLGLDARDFGTNGGGGRCQRCLGLGTAEDGGPCPVCGGLRFGIDVLSIRVDGRNLAEALAVPIADIQANGRTSLLEESLVHRLVELGVGHLALGRSLDTLSGGEIQRLRIARALARHQDKGALFVIDEPACGLHPDDVARLERALRHIVADGANTVVIVEHDPYLLANADYIVEFGPVGGPGGGRVVAQGTPAEVMRGSTATGRALAGKAPAPRPRKQHSLRVPVPTTIEVAQRVRAEIRQIVGDDVEVPDGGDVVRPAAILDSSDQRRAYEQADLDRAVASVLVDQLPAPESALAHLLATWEKAPRAALQVHPMLDALATWGGRVPASVVQVTNRHVAAMGLEPPVSDTAAASGARVRGKRLVPTDDSQSAREASLRDAWALGNGYVELIGSDRVLATVSDRLLDLEHGSVGPRRPRPGHFSRRDPLGRCPNCQGACGVPSLDEKLLIRSQTASVTAEGLLHSAAADVLKGIRRSEMLPFFRRLADEMLWQDRPWNRLSDSERDVVLYGFWIRPGHGTFLKAGKDIDGSEANHWLRWDGLVAAVLSQLSRSKDKKWRESIERSRSTRTCPVCNGSGLARHSRLLRLGSRNLEEWVLEGTIGQFVQALEALKPTKARATHTRDRVVACFRSVRASKSPMQTVQSGEGGAAILAEATKAFTGLTVLFT